MASAIATYCRETGQPEPSDRPAYTRAILESLAFKYRVVLESMERLTGIPITEIRVVGGGSRNRLLNQFTADATGRTVVAGPVEASALGNIAMQMVAAGAVASLAEARAIIERSFPVERFEPVEPRSMEARTTGVSTSIWSPLVSETLTDETTFLQNLWNERGRARAHRSSCCAIDRTCWAPTCASPISAAATPARSSICRIR